MDESTFFGRLRLQRNPFQFTNADEEDNLPDYFVQPPYFDPAWGEPETPSPCVVFGLRGAGKSALRRMMELRSREKDVFAIQYSRFEFDAGQSLNNIDLNYHLRNLITLSLVGLLMTIYDRNLNHLSFSAAEQQEMKQLVGLYLGRIQPDQLKSATKAIMTPLGRAQAFLRERLWIVDAVVSAIMSKVGLSSGQVPVQDASIEPASKNHLEAVVNLLCELGYTAVYVLVDKVDETSVTGNDSKASFDLIAPMLRDLELLQMKKVGFKFFLWNEIGPYYRRYARPDRVEQFNISWKTEELKEMMRRRLTAHAVHRELTFFDLFDASMGTAIKESVELLVFAFSHGSPRDMIRICQHMTSEQLRFDPSATGIGLKGVTDGLDSYCNQRAEEVVPPGILSELRKTHRLDFTVNYVANDVFKISQNGARSKIKTWMDAGVVKHVDDVKTDRPARPVHHFAVTDSRVAKVIFKELNFLDFLSQKLVLCRDCNQDLLRDWDLSNQHLCHRCGKRFSYRPPS